MAKCVILLESIAICSTRQQKGVRSRGAPRSGSQIPMIAGGNHTIMLRNQAAPAGACRAQPWCFAQRIPNRYTCRWQVYHNEMKAALSAELCVQCPSAFVTHCPPGLPGCCFITCFSTRLPSAIRMRTSTARVRNALAIRPADAKSAACSAALSATRKEERKNEKEEVIYFIYSPVVRACSSLNLYGFIIPIKC